MNFNFSYQETHNIKDLNKLVLPGTCKIDAKVYFFSGLLRKKIEKPANDEDNKINAKIDEFFGILDEEIPEDKFVDENISDESDDKIEEEYKTVFLPNKKIYCIDLDTRNIQVLRTKFLFGPFTELKCTISSATKILILGGYDKHNHYNRRIFKFTMDEKCKESKIPLPEGIRLDDYYPPIGKYNFSVFFSYPSAYLFVSSEHRRECLNISAKVEIKAVQKIPKSPNTSLK